MVQEEVTEHDRTFIASNPPRDFIDIYLANIKATTNPDSSFYQNIGYKQLDGTLNDFFGAGSETTTAILTWSILYLTINPQMQKKAQSEIDEVVGKNRKPTLADRPKMPFIEAFMQEVLRKSSILLLGLFHSTLQDVVFQGYEIPKDTYIIPNIYGAHHDADIWRDPVNFRPERFLSPDGTMYLKSDNVLTFSTGKRTCPGEPLARDTFYLFLTNIIQRFEIQLNGSPEEMSLEPTFGLVTGPRMFSVLLKDRIMT